MPRYQNGRAPLGDLVKFGEQHYLPVGTAARWRELQRLAQEKYGVWLAITSGWNGYRPYDIQVQYRKELGIWAAVPGYSSHGLVYQGRDCAAIDVNNWGALAPGNSSLAWSRFVVLCRLVGFTVDFVSPQELWHIGDFDPFIVPAFASITINPGTTARPPIAEEDDMLIITATSSSKDGVILEGRTYVDSLTAPIALLSAAEVDAYRWHSKNSGIPFRETKWPGDDLRGVVAVRGLRPFDQNTGRADYTAQIRY
ncbi:M15 family metallopeptidase [Microbacterium sp. BH-3-3-3]|uniref:M15 family metallopeptidase n=1 Tax=Microbacterium sp. BH-3-3-3 TaxID=1906742 RepID=UPI0011A89997|nr:M15 family metallopeptidase [Microbacterium sp. BH-3-3-3]